MSLQPAVDPLLLHFPLIPFLNVWSHLIGLDMSNCNDYMIQVYSAAYSPLDELQMESSVYCQGIATEGFMHIFSRS